MSKIKTIPFIHTPLIVQAIQVTEDNMADVAEWCGGSIKYDGIGIRRPYIDVKVNHPLRREHTMAYVGCWVTFTKQGFKVYAEDKFRKKHKLFKEPECGDTRYTLDHEPCVLGKGHLEGLTQGGGCRSLQDYKYVKIDGVLEGLGYPVDAFSTGDEEVWVDPEPTTWVDETRQESPTITFNLPAQRTSHDNVVANVSTDQRLVGQHRLAD